MTKEQAPTLDKHRIDDLLALAGTAELNEIFRMFLEDSQRRVSSMERAFDEADAESLTRQAHALKGAAANVGAARLAELARRLEAGQTENHSPEQWVDLLRDELSAIAAALRAL